MVESGRLTDRSADLARRVIFPAGPVAVGLSGGADSAALLWLLVEHGIPCRAVHVIHGLPASAMMATAAGQVAAGLGVALSMVPVEPDSASESDLRDARHEALLASRSDDEVVALAHTSDDQAETVLMRIMRGTGVEGLGAMEPVDDRFVRPLLEISRDETRELARSVGLPFRDDPANDDPSHLRNRIRSEVIPVLEEVASAPVRHRLVALAGLARRESEWIASLAATLPVESRAEAVRVPLGSLVAVDEVVAARVVREMIRRLLPPHPPGRDAAERVLGVVGGNAASAEVGGGVVARREGPYLVLGRPPAQDDPWDPAHLKPGSSVSVAGWRIEARWCDGPRPAPLSLRSLAIPDRLVGTIEVRRAAPGDRVTGRRVSAALSDAGVPAVRRTVWPVVAVGGEVVWVPAARRRVWSGATSGRYLGLTASEEPAWQTFEL